jgi:class 3 adenylate cyclase
MTVPTGERRIVSVLLADIADSTAIGERLGPERSKFLFDEVTRLLSAEVKRFGGTIAQLTGDGLYALFGVPHAHDDDAERAVRARYDAASAGYPRREEARRRAGRPRGASTPAARSFRPRTPRRGASTPGDTVNTARLQSAAGRGGVAVSPATAQQIGGCSISSRSMFLSAVRAQSSASRQVERRHGVPSAVTRPRRSTMRWPTSPTAAARSSRSPESPASARAA